VASAVVGPVLAVAGLLLTYAVRDRLPEPLAVHWGTSGQPDRFASLSEAAVTAAAMTALLPLMFVALGAAWHPSARGPLVVVAVLGLPWMLLLAVAIVALLVLTCSARVVVDGDGLRVTSLFVTWSRVPLERIAEARTGRVSPLREFGGYGWRIGRDGSRGFVTRSGEALVVERVGEPSVVVTVDGADEAAAALNTLASRRL
jgi:hypothetical protein